MGLHALVVGRQNIDLFAAQVQILAAQHLRAFYRQRTACSKLDIALTAADGATRAALRLPVIGGFKRIFTVTETDAAGAGQAGFFLLAPVIFLARLVGGGDIEVIARQQANVLSGRHAAAAHQQIVSCLHHHAVAADATAQRALVLNFIMRFYRFAGQ